MDKAFAPAQALCENRNLVLALQAKNFKAFPDSRPISRYNLFIIFTGVLELFSQTSCSNLKDRIFAMLGHPIVGKLDQAATFKPDYSLTPSELILVTLEWCDVLRDHSDHDRNGDKIFSLQLMNLIWKGLTDGDHTDVTLPSSGLLRLIRAHKDWDRSGLPEYLITHSGRRVDCTGWVIRHLVRENTTKPTRQCSRVRKRPEHEVSWASWAKLQIRPHAF